MSKGVFVVSVDTELAWGRETPRDLVRYIPHYKGTRSAISAILEMCERYKMAFTWALVGELLSDYGNNRSRWAKNHDFHNHHMLPQSAFMWHGRDIVDSIRNCHVTQEIGCHSFSHISYDEKDCPVTAASSDLALCRKVFTPLGLNWQTFIFPLNRMGHLPLLAQHGFICFRGPGSDAQSRVTFLTPFLRVFRFLWRLYAGPPLTTPIEMSQGLVNIPASMFFRVPEIKNMVIWRKILGFQLATAKQGLLKATRTGLIFHLWFHPFQFGRRSNEMLGALDEVLSLASGLRSDNQLEILTMGQLAQRLIQSKNRKVKLVDEIYKN